MRAERASLAQETLLVDHQNADGPTITHVRGILLANAVQNLKNLGLYEDYCKHMPTYHLRALTDFVAMSWVPVEHALAHYEACDKLPITGEQYAEIGARQADRIRETFLGFAVQRARKLGVDSLKQTMTQVGRLHDRIYRGGGCAVFDVGPKDVVFEISGFPFASMHSFRAGWLGYAEAVAKVFTRVCYIKLARPRVLHPNRLALAVTWV